MAENNSIEYEHRLRQTEAQSDQQPEHGAGQVANSVHDFKPSTFLDPTAGSRVNSSARATAMLNGQRAYGNRAVQRFVQRRASSSPDSRAGTLAVQRYQRPDENWFWNTLSSG